MSTADHLKANQVLRLKVGDHLYKGVIVNMGEETMLVATTSQDAPTVPNGTTVSGEIFKADGLYHFTARLMGYQLMPVLVLILDRPKAIRRIQRRREPRHPVTASAKLIFISAERTINADVAVRNLSFGGMEVLSPGAPPLGLHCVVLLQHQGRELSTICQVMHVEATPEGSRLGLAFVEMSRRDLDALHAFISQMEAEEE
jgi:c-di-GMP-binding flagellar brake protein YcgR